MPLPLVSQVLSDLAKDEHDDEEQEWFTRYDRPTDRASQ